MATINKVDYTNSDEVMQKMNLGPMLLLEFEEGISTGLTLADNTVESINGVLYYITGGDLSVDISEIPITGQAYYYVYISPDFTDISKALVEISDIVPEWEPNKNGFYSGIKKAIHKVFRNFSNYTETNYLSTAYDVKVTGRIDIQGSTVLPDSFKTSQSLNGTYTGTDIINTFSPIFTNDNVYEERAIHGFIHDVLTGDNYYIVSARYADTPTIDHLIFTGMKNLSTTGASSVGEISIIPGNDYIISIAW